MATPRTLTIPPGVDARGGAALTSIESQGVAAIEQQLALAVLGPGRSTNPWMQREDQLSSTMFQEMAQGAHDLELRIRSVLAQLEAQELARLLSVRIVRGDQSGGDTKAAQLYAEVDWQPLRLSADLRQKITTRVGPAGARG